MASPHHKLSAHCRIGSLALDVDLDLSAPWTLLFGPSGSGKSSLLRATCGLLDSDGIRFSRGTVPLQDIPTHLRSLSWAPQHASLFPHLTVSQNLSFGERVTPGKWDYVSLSEVIDLFKLEPLMRRRPADLSGGERRRVSLARAFAAPNCKLMLLDEPFAGIDHTLRDDLLPQMRCWLLDRGIPALSVSHDVEEALQLQAEVVLLRDGKIKAQGPAPEVLHTERKRLLLNLSR